MWPGRLLVKHEVILSEVHFQTPFINICWGFSGLVCCKCFQWLSCGRRLLCRLVALMENHLEGFFPTHWQLGSRRKGQKPFKAVDVAFFLMELIILALEMSLHIVSYMYNFPGGSDGKEFICNAGDDHWVRKITWRRKWQPTPVFLLGKSYGQWSLVGYSPWDRKRDMT